MSNQGNLGGKSLGDWSKWAKPVQEGQVIELIEGHFEYNNGLYTESQTAPSIWDSEVNDYHSIYHLFGNDLENFLDCEVVS